MRRATGLMAQQLHQGKLSTVSRLKRIAAAVPVLGPLARKALFHFRAVAGSLRLKGYIRRGGPLRIVVGSRGMAERGWVATDIEFLDLLKREHWERFFEPDSIEAIVAEHVWEHLTPSEALTAAQNCYRFLKPGGYIRVAVPDGYHPDPEYIKWVEVGGIGRAAGDHKVLYNHETLLSLFEQARFRVTALEYFDASGLFHYADWDVTKGLIRRSKRFDPRNSGGALVYTSVLIDARK